MCYEAAWATALGLDSHRTFHSDEGVDTAHHQGGDMHEHEGVDNEGRGDRATDAMESLGRFPEKDQEGE